MHSAGAETLHVGLGGSGSLGKGEEIDIDRYPLKRIKSPVLLSSSQEIVQNFHFSYIELHYGLHQSRLVAQQPDVNL